jgi:hypothetical protein
MKTKLKVGDLIQHIGNKKFGVVMSDVKKWGGGALNGIPFCKVVWLDYHGYNLMDIRMLKRVTPKKDKKCPTDKAKNKIH